MTMTAIEFLRHAPEGKYDAIIVDSSDPVGGVIDLYMIFCLKLFSPCWVCYLVLRCLCNCFEHFWMFLIFSTSMHMYLENHVDEIEYMFKFCSDHFGVGIKVFLYKIAKFSEVYLNQNVSFDIKQYVAIIFRISFCG